MECKRIQSYLERYLANDLQPQEAQMVSEHLRDCAICRNERDFLERLNHQLNQQTCVPVPENFTAAIMKQIAAPPAAKPSSILLYRQWGISFVAAGLILLLLNMTPFMSRIVPLPEEMGRTTMGMVTHLNSWSLRGVQSNVSNTFYDLTDLLTKPVIQLYNLYQKGGNDNAL